MLECEYCGNIWDPVKTGSCPGCGAHQSVATKTVEPAKWDCYAGLDQLRPTETPLLALMRAMERDRKQRQLGLYNVAQLF